MSQKSFNKVAAVVFSAVALLHLFRIFYSWEAVIGGWNVPMWLSFAAVALAGYLAYRAFTLNN